MNILFLSFLQCLLLVILFIWLCRVCSSWNNYSLSSIEESYKDSRLQTPILHKTDKQPLLPTLYIYIIHKTDMKHRHERFTGLLSKHFPTIAYQIVEPVPLSDVYDSLTSLLESNQLTHSSYLSILSGQKAKRGSHTVQSMSLTLTNIQIWEMESRQRQPRPFLILEDDFTLPGTFDADFQDMIRHLPSSWDMIYLSCHIRKEEYQSSNRNHQLLPIHTRTHGQGAVLYHPNVVPLLLSAIYPIHLQIDHDIPDRLIMTKRIKAFMAVNTHLDTLIFNDNFYYGSSTQ